jgi:hypothetical protein
VAMRTIKKASEFIDLFSTKEGPYNLNSHQYKEELELKVALKYF